MATQARINVAEVSDGRRFRYTGDGVHRARIDSRLGNCGIAGFRLGKLRLVPTLSIGFLIAAICIALIGRWALLSDRCSSWSFLPAGEFSEARTC